MVSRRYHNLWINKVWKMNLSSQHQQLLVVSLYYRWHNNHVYSQQTCKRKRYVIWNTFRPNKNSVIAALVSNTLNTALATNEPTTTTWRFAAAEVDGVICRGNWGLANERTDCLLTQLIRSEGIVGGLHVPQKEVCLCGRRVVCMSCVTSDKESGAWTRPGQAH